MPGAQTLLPWRRIAGDSAAHACKPEHAPLKMRKRSCEVVLACTPAPLQGAVPLQEADEEAAAGPVEEDSYEILVSGGVHPLLAARAADTAFPEAFVLAWSLLLACMMDSSHDGRRRLGLTCGHVDRCTSA